MASFQAATPIGVCFEIYPLRTGGPASRKRSGSSSVGTILARLTMRISTFHPLKSDKIEPLC